MDVPNRVLPKTLKEGDFTSLLVNTFLVINVLRNIGRCQQCSDKFDIIHHIYSKNELDHLLSYSVQNVIGFIYHDNK